MDATQIRAELDHPVIDADGHIIEFLPLLRDLVADEAGGAVADRFDALAGSAAVRRSLDDETKRAHALARTGWWALPSRNTLDRATAMLPRLLYERLDELGIDVAVLYPTVGLTVMAVDDQELRCAVARACNRYYADAYGPYADRLRPVGVIPTYDPDEAIAELEYATGTLGLKGFLFGGLVLRPAPGHATDDRAARWVDGLGLDSAHDYDPLWRRCVELGVSPTFHSTGIGFGSRTSPTSYVANHIGNFAAGGEAVCRSLFFGGAMSRFPELRWAFLEGGVAWACNLLADTVGHFEKRNREALAHYDPAELDRDALRDLVQRFGDASFTDRIGRLGDTLGLPVRPRRGPGRARRVGGERRAVDRRHRGDLHRAVLLRVRGRRPDERARLRRPRATPTAAGCRRCSPRTSATGTCPTSEVSSRRRGSSWSTTSSIGPSSATSCSATSPASSPGRTRTSSPAPRSRPR